MASPGTGGGGGTGDNAAAVATLINRLSDILAPAIKGVFERIGAAFAKPTSATAAAAAATAATLPQPVAGTMLARQPAVSGIFGSLRQIGNTPFGKEVAGGITGQLSQLAMMQTGGGFGTNLLAGILPGLGKFAGPWGAVGGAALSLLLKQRATEKAAAAAAGGGADGGGGAGGGGGPLDEITGQFQSAANKTASFVQDYSPQSVRLYTQAMRDLNAVIGKNLTPAMTTFKDIAREVGSSLNSLTPHVKPIFEGLRDALKPVISVGGGVLRQVGSAVAPLFDSLGKIVPMAGKMVEPLAKMAGGVLNSAISQVGRLVEQFSNWLPKAMGEVGKVMDQLRPSLDSIGESFKSVMAALGDAATTAFAASLQAVAATFKAMTPVITIFAGQLQMVAKFVELNAKGFQRFVEANQKLASFFGIGGGPQARGPLDRQDNTGLAYASTSTTSVSAMLQQLREQAYGLGGDGTGSKAEGPQERTANALDTLLSWLQDKGPKRLVDEFEHRFPGLKIMIEKAGEAGQSVEDYARKFAQHPRDLLRAVVPAFGLLGG